MFFVENESQRLKDKDKVFPPSIAFLFKAKAPLFTRNQNIIRNMFSIRVISNIRSHRYKVIPLLFIHIRNTTDNRYAGTIQRCLRSVIILFDIFRRKENETFVKRAHYTRVCTYLSM